MVHTFGQPHGQLTHSSEDQFVSNIHTPVAERVMQHIAKVVKRHIRDI